MRTKIYSAKPLGPICTRVKIPKAIVDAVDEAITAEDALTAARQAVVDARKTEVASRAGRTSMLPSEAADALALALQEEHAAADRNRQTVEVAYGLFAEHREDLQKLCTSKFNEKEEAAIAAVSKAQSAADVAIAHGSLFAWLELDPLKGAPAPGGQLPPVGGQTLLRLKDYSPDAVRRRQVEHAERQEQARREQAAAKRQILGYGAVL